MDKRTFYAIALSLAVLLGWNYLAERLGWIQPVPVTQTVVDSTAPAASASVPANLNSTGAAPAFVPSPGREVRVETPLYSAVFHSGGGVLQSFVLKNFKVTIQPDSPLVQIVNDQAAKLSPLGLLVDGQPSWSVGQWAFEGENLQLASGQKGVLRFRGVVNGLNLVRELSFDATTYLIEEKLFIQSSTGSRSVRVGFTLGTKPLSNEGEDYNLTRVAWDVNGKLKEEDDTAELTQTGLTESGSLLWGGVMSTYFLAAIAPQDDAGVEGAEGSYTFKARVQNGVYRVGMEKGNAITVPDAGRDVHVAYWLGPKDRDLLAVAPNKLAQSIDLGIFSIIAEALVWLLGFFYDYVGNYGTAIILLTVCVKLAFWPRTEKSYKSMEKMRVIQPMMTQIREKYADDRDTMNREMMALYKTYGVNPAGGCLPILLQLPVFFGLYMGLLNALELRHAAFITYLPFTDKLWLADLSARDPFYITPILMGISMFLQQKLSPQMGDPMQQKIMLFMPVIFTVMFLGFPSGLVVYWLCSNLLSIAQQWLQMRRRKAAAV